MVLHTTVEKYITKLNNAPPHHWVKFFVRTYKKMDDFSHVLTENAPLFSIIQIISIFCNLAISVISWQYIMSSQAQVLNNSID